MLLTKIEEYLTYKPDSTDYGGLNGFDIVSGFVKSKAGDDIHWNFCNLGADRTIIFFHGNIANISRYGFYYQLFKSLNLNFLTFDYPSYGKSSGRPSESSLYASGEAICAMARKNLGIAPSSLVYYGLSLGGAVSVEMSLSLPPQKLILEGSFTSSRDMGKFKFGVLPIPLLATNKYRSVEKIASINRPLLILQASGDQTVPVKFAQALFNSAMDPKKIHIIDGANHSNVVEIGGESLAQVIREFLDS